ncbi:hypothetical protein LOTGIDRAFT_233106 [Lottia gigantea]|uniref:Uncharacterized protein n=1 Tax=Lottia gigantea TaxID=225164 RepID=V4A6K5_LOTGI|nr:hypothetical protein LOTGIDRAFT_233106 [Lottia gigantea]ESO92332.1 hypothetical protein LOTGIDRAFT_233106 [Lottia gigantea]
MEDMKQLSEVEVKNIAQNEKSKGCLILGRLLGVLPYDRELDMTTDIYIEYIYDHISYCVEKGFPWKYISYTVQFADELLKTSKGKSLAETISWYRQKSAEVVHILGEEFFKKYTDFVFTTFMPHYKLYQYVFLNEREKMIPHVDVEINPPVSPLSLKESKEKDIFEYEQRIAELEKHELEKEKEILLEKEQIHERTEEKTNELLEKIKLNEESLTKESLSEMIKNVIQTHTSCLAEDLKLSIMKTQESLEYKLEKTSLPRPQALGPPPRYKPKTPVNQKGRKSPETKPKSASKISSKSK